MIRLAATCRTLSTEAGLRCRMAARGGSYGPQRADLGWAIDEEAGFDTTLIYYPQGFYSPDCTWMPKSGIYELTDEHGTVYQFVGAGGIARIVTSKSVMRKEEAAYDVSRAQAGRL